MIVVDSSAPRAILRREPEADPILQVIEMTDACLLSSISLLETSMVPAGRNGDAVAWTELDALLECAAMQVIPHDTSLAEEARAAFLRYGKGRPPAGLNLGDCTAYAWPKPATCHCGSTGRFCGWIEALPALSERRPALRAPAATLFCGVRVFLRGGAGLQTPGASA